MNLTKDKSNFLLRLNHDEALVLLDWLFRFNEKESLNFFEDQAEQRVLWDLEAILEKDITEVFSGKL